MLHVILLILKIIGILLLAVIGLLLLAILTVLLVPIRYKLFAEHGEALWLQGRANWLLHVIRARFSYIEGVLHIRVNVLWVTLFDNLNPKQPKDKQKKEIKKKEVKKKEAKKEEAKKTEDKKVEAKKVEAKKKEDKTEAAERQEVIKKEEIRKEEIRKDVISKDVIRKEENKNETQSKDAGNSVMPIDSINAEKASISNKAEMLTEAAKAESNGQAEKEVKKTVIQKILIKVKSIREKIKNFFIGLKNKLINWFNTAVNIKHKIGLVMDFLKDQINREGFQITYSSLKRLLKHILPTKLKSKIRFGTGDPCTTGQALGVMGILYSFYGDNIQVIPDFENKVLEGKHYARGRIRLITVLIIVIKLILDKRFKQLRKNFQLLKEAL